jgi:nucleoside-diphosphate-sugar epimerase
MRVAIVGCGYLGLELARQLSTAGHDVTGVRRSMTGVESIRDCGVAGVQADVTDPDTLMAVPDVDVVVYAASAGGRGAGNARDVYVTGLTNVIDHFSSRSNPPSRLVYTSSTGVFGDHDGAWVDETTPIDRSTPRRATLADAEAVALERTTSMGIDGTVVRLGGLYGPDRYPVDRYLDGPVVSGHLNLIHRDDAAGAIRFLLEGDLARNDIVVVVDDEPVSKWEFADWLAEECGREPPEKLTIAERVATDDLSEGARERIEADKRCSNATLRALGYEYSYPTVFEGVRPAIEDRCGSN